MKKEYLKPELMDIVSLPGELMDKPFSGHDRGQGHGDPDPDKHDEPNPGHHSKAWNGWDDTED